MFAGKVLLITGGTGSFGNAVLSRFLDTDISEIRIFSPNLSFILGMFVMSVALLAQCAA